MSFADDLRKKTEQSSYVSPQQQKYMDKEKELRSFVRVIKERSLNDMISRIKVNCEVQASYGRNNAKIRFGGGWYDEYSNLASDLYFYKPGSYKPPGLFSKTIYGLSSGTILDQELGQYLKQYFYSIGINNISIAPEQEYDPYRSKYFLTVYVSW